MATPTPIALFFLPILLIGASMLSDFSDSMVNANSEGDALTAFKQSLSDPNNALQSWDPTLIYPCTWFFVTCNAANQVTRLEMSSRNLAGHLVPELGNLPYLQILSLENNNLQGTIPPELGNLKSLVTLELQDNNLTGTIPPSLGNLKTLMRLRLNNNRGLSGDLPQEVSTLPNLKILDFSNTNVAGPTNPRNIAQPTNTIKNMGAPSLGLSKLFFLMPILAFFA